MELDTPAKVQAKIASLHRKYAIEMNHARSPAINAYSSAIDARDQANRHVNRCEQISYLI